MNRKTISVTLTTLLLLLLVPSSVKADGFSIYTDSSFFSLHTEETQVAAINYESGREELFLAVKLRKLESNSVVWIIPVPANASNVNINILEQFPQFYGEDILLRAEEIKNEVLATASILVSMSQIYTTPLLAILGSMALTFSFMGEGDVEVHAHIEKEGIVTEVVTAENANALYDYLKTKNITIAVGSIPIINDYIGKTYSFVVSWVKSIEDERKMPAIYVSFPTDEIYYPLKPTSVYGNTEIPILIYVAGYAKPKLYPEIEPYTEYRYFKGSTFGTYTRITIGQTPTTKGTTIGQSSTPPSTNFVDDLWIEKFAQPPASVERAARTLFIHENMLYFIIAWLIIASMLAGSLTGYLMFRDFKKFALIGLANCFTIVGTIIATYTFVKEKRANFIGFFSIIFLLINFLVILPIVAILIL
jgi:hypothetical protein